jgi:hypothetical protein
LPSVKRFKKCYKFIGLKKAFPEIPPVLPFSKGGELFLLVSMAALFFLLLKRQG